MQRTTGVGGILVLLAMGSGCGPGTEGVAPPMDAGGRDGGAAAGVDAEVTDGGELDGGVARDGGSGDAAPRDGSVARDGGDPGLHDAGDPNDAGMLDAGPRDAGPRDAGPRDAGPRDAGPRDAGPRDAGPRDAGPPDAGFLDGGTTDAGTGSIPIRLIGSWDSFYLWQGTVTSSDCSPLPLPPGGACTLWVTPGSWVDVFASELHGSCYSTVANEACPSVPNTSCTPGVLPWEWQCTYSNVVAPFTFRLQLQYDGDYPGSPCGFPSMCWPMMECGSYGNAFCGSCPAGEACALDANVSYCHPTLCP